RLSSGALSHPGRAGFSPRASMWRTRTYTFCRCTSTTTLRPRRSLKGGARIRPRKSCEWLPSTYKRACALKAMPQYNTELEPTPTNLRCAAAFGRGAPPAFGFLIADKWRQSLLGSHAFISLCNYIIRSLPQTLPCATARWRHTMIDIWFEGHAQTYHNAAGVASGHYDVALTEHGRTHAQSVLRSRYADQPF